MRSTNKLGTNEYNIKFDLCLYMAFGSIGSTLNEEDDTTCYSFPTKITVVAVENMP